MPAVVAAIKQGAVDFLSKPVDPAELCCVVGRALRTDAELARLARDGFVILEGLLSASERAAILEALAPYEADRPMGRNDFEGCRTQRVYSLAGQGDAFLRLAEHPRIVRILAEKLLPGYLLSNLQSIRVHPGETPQGWHTDDAFYPVPRPHGALAISTIWVLEAFTEENGATELVPGSHLWGGEHPDDRPHEVKKAVMPAGSVVIFDAALWHRGGARARGGGRKGCLFGACRRAPRTLRPSRPRRGL